MSAQPTISGPSQPAECQEEDNEMSTSRASTIKLNRSRSIPYPFPSSGLQFSKSIYFIRNFESVRVIVYYNYNNTDSINQIWTLYIFTHGFP
jgi:hypothetical protein